MEELINIVVEKTGLPEEQAKRAVDAVLDFVKDKLPEPIAAEVDSLIAGDAGLGQAGDLLKGLGGMFGG